ncbi:MAG: hypothetical protein WDA27_09110 [Actinomycetota bacterium]
MRGFAVVAVVGSFVVGAAAGSFGRLLFRPHRGLTLFALPVLLPWGLHHLEILRFAESAGAGDLGAARIAGPVTLAALTAVVLAAARRAPFLVAGIPPAGFLVAFYVTFPLASSAVPGRDIGYDNVGTVWLFVYTVAATAALLAYFRPPVLSSTPAA